MKKVIVKYKISDREKFVKELAQSGLAFGPAYYQHDRVYVPRNYKPNSNYARLILRTEVADVEKTPKYRLILKRYIADSGITVVNNTVIKDYAEAVHIIHQLGFEKKAEISRRREELELTEKSKMYLDKVEGLAGYYAKIEDELDEDERTMELREDLVRTFELLGETNERRDTYADLKSAGKEED